MVNVIMVDMLVNKIRTGEINPNTNEAFKLDDIKNLEYKNAVEAKLSTA